MMLLRRGLWDDGVRIHAKVDRNVRSSTVRHADCERFGVVEEHGL